jgi:AraC-like DNA-binding protein
MIVGCLLDRVGRARIDDGAKGVDRTLWLDTFADVHATVSGRPAEVFAVVVGWADITGVPPTRLISEILSAFPNVPILGYCLSTAERLEDLRRMAVAGVHQLLLDTTADSRSVVRSVLESTKRQCAATQIFAQIKDVVPPRLRPVILTALENPGRAATVASLARELGIDRKTLHNWCRSERFLAPRDVVRWSRLLLAAALLNWSSRSVASVAIELDFPTDNTLRVAIRRQFGVQPSAMKRAGVDKAVAAFRAQVARVRQPTKSIAVA